jgi:glutamyl-Q tRNA(Asp) synthetase
VSVANGNTATGTTVTADAPRAYRGRFAPSPSGALHLGSLAAALGSWLDARHHGGRWLIRIEDLDTARVLPGAADTLVRTLARLGLESDEPLLYQSTRHEAYEAAFDRLRERGLLYPCSCTRRETAAGPYAGSCRGGPKRPGPWAWRLRLPAGDCHFQDRFQGAQCLAFEALGDPVLRRRDGVMAYQLAVVVDDAHQGITDVVRGADLLDATAWQLEIRRHLGYPSVNHGHLPLVLDPGGEKLSKSRSSAAIAGLPPAQALREALAALRQPTPPPGLDSPPELLDWALAQWRPDALASFRNS